MISFIIQTFFKIKIQTNMSEQEKKRKRICESFNTETKSKFPCLLYSKQRKIFLQKKKKELF